MWTWEQSCICTYSRIQHWNTTEVEIYKRKTVLSFLVETVVEILVPFFSWFSFFFILTLFLGRKRVFFLFILNLTFFLGRKTVIFLLSLILPFFVKSVFSFFFFLKSFLYRFPPLSYSFHIFIFIYMNFLTKYTGNDIDMGVMQSLINSLASNVELQLIRKYISW